MDYLAKAYSAHAVHLWTHRRPLLSFVPIEVSHSGVILLNSGGPTSFMEGGGIVFGVFVVYIIIYGIAWYKGSSKREFMKREAVEEELRREREADGAE